MNQPIEFHDPLHGFRMWFRGLSKPIQWLLGPPIIVACLWIFWAETFANPDGPKQAIYITLLIIIVTLVLTEVLRPKPNIENARPAGLGDFQVPTTTEGRPVPLMWGTIRQRGSNVVWYGDLLQLAITEKVSTGLWSSTRITKGFHYHLGMQFALCRGPNVVLKRVWIGDDEVFSGTISTDGGRFDINEPELFGGDETGTGGVQATCDFYTGSSTQLVNAYLNDDARQRISTAITPTAPRYIGTCYLVARQLTGLAPTTTDAGAYLGNTTSIKAWSFELERFSALFSGQSAGDNIISTFDVNPINVIYEILTNDEWGFGFPDADVDLTNFLASSNTIRTEGNGFSMLLDRFIPAKELLTELQRQIEGVVFLSQVTGKWTIKLARDDYDIDLIPQLTDINVTEVRDFTRGSWEDTTNTITVQYDKRDDDYKLSYALAQDMANAMIQGDGTVAGAQSVTGNVSFPGVKDSALASNLAWRELRGHSFPLARMQLVVNRQMWDVAIGDVVAWTNVQLGFVKLPVRITRVDYGRLQDNKMTLIVVQDVFKQAAASMGTPTPTNWIPPTTAPVNYPATEKRALECPRAILVRDPQYAGNENISKVLCAARNQVGEILFEIGQSNAASSPSTTVFTDAGSVIAFVRIGQLASVLASGTAIPTATITLDATPDSQTNLEAAFDDNTTLLNLGVDLAQLVLVDDEFMLVQKAAINGADVDLQNVYRGALDSAQASHSAGANVYLLHLGAGLTDTTFNTLFDVNIVHRMRTTSAVSTNTDFVALTMAQRSIRPYPPAASFYNGGSTPFNTPALENSGSGLNGVGFDVDWRRRRYDALDEVVAILNDTDPDASLATNTGYRIRVFVDPSGTNVLVFDTGVTFLEGVNSLTTFPTQAEIVNEAAAGTEIRVEIESRHSFDGGSTFLNSRSKMIHDVNPTSPRTSQSYLGGDLAINVASAAYPVTTTSTHNVTIGAGYSTANVQININSGGWNNVIAAGAGTTGSVALTSGDSIQLRVTANELPARNFVEIDDGTSDVAYGVFTDGS